MTPTDQQRFGDDRAPDSTLQLFAKARSGDSSAFDLLCTRLLPRLTRFASRRLPVWARGMLDTDDLVQETLLTTVRDIGALQLRNEGALQAYMRQMVLNRISDQIRQARRRPASEPLDPATAREPSEMSPLEQAIGREQVERYERALASLREEDREAIVGRIELGLSYQELAEALGKPTADAARMAVGRAVLRLTEELGDGD
jgi:RNA polymerase sigma-70 factor (ECF subfamily)